MTSELDGKFLEIEFDDATFRVPLAVVARSHAENYASDYEGGVEECLREETIPQFLARSYNATDWASNNMNWSDLEPHAVRVERPRQAVDREGEWGNAPKRVVAEARS